MNNPRLSLQEEYELAIKANKPLELIEDPLHPLHQGIILGRNIDVDLDNSLKNRVSKALSKLNKPKKNKPVLEIRLLSAFALNSFAPIDRKTLELLTGTKSLSALIRDTYKATREFKFKVKSVGGKKMNYQIFDLMV